MTTTCRAHRVNDQMICPCGRQWDANDPEPPACRTETIVMDARRPGKRTAYLEFIKRFGIGVIK